MADWIKGRPAVHGWYWLYVPGRELECVAIFERYGYVYVSDGDNFLLSDSQYDNASWLIAHVPTKPKDESVE